MSPLTWRGVFRQGANPRGPLERDAVWLGIVVVGGLFKKGVEGGSHWWVSGEEPGNPTPAVLNRKRSRVKARSGITRLVFTA